jgi:hypothetical protein
MAGGERTGVRTLIMDLTRQDSRFPKVRRLLIMFGETLNTDSLCEDMRQTGGIPEWKLRIYRLIFRV